MVFVTKGSRFGSTEKIQIHLAFGFFVRIAFILYGEHHDQSNALKYTDIDYHVFTDGAREVSKGGNPFDRHTYRYTPFMAWMMLPNVLMHFTVGKVIFSFLDCMASRLIYEILLLDGQSNKTALKCCYLWLYNPMVIGVSTRGSAEAIMAVLILITIYLAKLKVTLLSGIFLGLSIHFRLYPVIYCIPIYLSLTSDLHSESKLQQFLPNRHKIRLVIGTTISFCTFTGLGFYLYGEQYLEEGFLYHLTRIDTRHNFSVFFYLLYITADYHIPGLSLCTFGPQFVLVTALGIKFGNHLDVNLAMFAQTVVFVTFNKVVTAQYFLWYFLLLPLIVPRLDMSWVKAGILTILWFVAEISWLTPAYFLEFQAFNTFVPIWLESVAFFCCNMGILMAIISSYKMIPFCHHQNSHLHLRRVIR